MKLFKKMLLTFIICSSVVVIYPSGMESSVLNQKDPLRAKQTYLNEIKLKQNSSLFSKNNSSVIVAVIDTGVDINHPDLKGQLIKGINLLKPGTDPIDDNGHGTNVAGVIVAKENNSVGILGIDPRAKVLPIKALDNKGKGEERILEQAIRYAVENKAKIIVLSLGLNTYSEILEKTINEANDKGVLVVAAVGNEGSNIKYPSAYKSVLAVGGVSSDRQHHYLSNTGPEIDIVAPWEVYTTDLDGKYTYKSGTSMSAPQVAGVAALMLEKNPSMKPDEIKNKLMHTAEDLETKGWDMTTGFGLLRADLALSENEVKDGFEPNDEINQANEISSDTEIFGSFKSINDVDWYKINCLYDGFIQISFSDSNIYSRNNDFSYIIKQGDQEFKLNHTNLQLKIQVQKGSNYISLQYQNKRIIQEIYYKMNTSFHVYADSYEKNDKIYQAYTILERNQAIIGTFHQKNDQDWFVLRAIKSGTIRLEGSTDTSRIDLKVSIYKKGETTIIIDETNEGEREEPALIFITPGEYYIQISNSEGNQYPITGEYHIDIEYFEKVIDPNEPNNKSYQATKANISKMYKGTFESIEDIDWYVVKINKESIIDFEIKNLLEQQRITFTLYDSLLHPIARERNSKGIKHIASSTKLLPGIYYISLESDKFMNNQFYNFVMNNNG